MMTQCAVQFCAAKLHLPIPMDLPPEEVKKVSIDKGLLHKLCRKLLCSTSQRPIAASPRDTPLHEACCQKAWRSDP